LPDKLNGPLEVLTTHQPILLRFPLWLGFALTVWSLPGQASEWMSCANRSHTLDILVDDDQRQIAAFALFVHGEQQDQLVWDMTRQTVDPAAHTLTLQARERSTTPRGFTLRVEESVGRFESRGPQFQLQLDLTCHWGLVGNR